MITITKYNKKLVNEWDSFISKSNNGTIFHKQQFLSYHVHRQFIDYSLIIKYKEKIVAIISAVELFNKTKKCFYSHPGASYGGLVLNNNISFQLINQIIISLEQYLIKHGFNNIFLINSPKIYYSQQNDSLEYLLYWNNYCAKEKYISHAVDLNKERPVSSLLSKRKYRYLQNNDLLQKIKFKKLIVTKDIDKITLFYHILCASKKQYDITPTHSLNELIKLLKLFPEDIQLYITLNKKNIIGGYLSIHANKKASLVFYNVVINKDKYKQTAMLQLYHSMKLAHKKGCQYIDFGVSHIPEGKNPLTPKFSLIQFKEQLGATGVKRTAFYKEF